MNEIKGDKIESYTNLRWVPFISDQGSEFNRLLDNKALKDNVFDEDYISRISNRSKELFRLELKLYIIGVLIYLALYMSINVDDLKVEIFGISIKELNAFKELLLPVAALILLTTKIISVQRESLDALIKTWLEKTYPDKDTRNYIALGLVDDYSAWTRFAKLDKHAYWYSGTAVIALFMFLVIALLILGLYILSFVVQINVFMEVYRNTSLPDVLHWVVLIISAMALVSVALLTILALPIPVKDYSNLYKLEKIKSLDPEKYEKIKSKIGIKERIRQLRLDSIRYVFFFALIWLCYLYVAQPHLFENWISVLFTTLFVTSLNLWISIQLRDILLRALLLWMGRKDNEAQQASISTYNKVKFVIRLLIPVGVIGLYLLVRISQ